MSPKCRLLLAVIAAWLVFYSVSPASAEAPAGATGTRGEAGLYRPNPVDGHLHGAARVNAAQSADALLVGFAAVKALKGIVRERRPDSDARDSFPSGHATLAFALATVQSHHDPDRSFLWYAGATAIGVSRVTSDRHYAHDALAGALLGHVIARGSLSRHRGLSLIPEYAPSRGMFQVGLHVAF